MGNDFFDVQYGYMDPVILSVSKKEFDGYASVARNACMKTLKKLKKKGVIELHLVTNEEMKKISYMTRRKNKTTNVLSFEAEGFPRMDVKGYLGEIYLAPDFIKKNKQDIELLAVHGTLHLFRYTHETKRDRIIMERVEDEILSFIDRS